MSGNGCSFWTIPPGVVLRTCCAEDLVILKAFAGRPQDWIDIESVLVRQRRILDWSLILAELEPLLALRETLRDRHRLHCRDHYYEHFETDRCFTTVFHVGDTIEGYRILRRLADSPRHIIPGQDPLVMARYPAASESLKGIAVRLDISPSE